MKARLFLIGTIALTLTSCSNDSSSSLDSRDPVNYKDHYNIEDSSSENCPSSPFPDQKTGLIPFCEGEKRAWMDYLKGSKTASLDKRISEIKREVKIQTNKAVELQNSLQGEEIRKTDELRLKIFRKNIEKKYQLIVDAFDLWDELQAKIAESQEDNPLVSEFETCIFSSARYTSELVYNICRDFQKAAKFSEMANRRLLSRQQGIEGFTDDENPENSKPPIAAADLGALYEEAKEFQNISTRILASLEKYRTEAVDGLTATKKGLLQDFLHVVPYTSVVATPQELLKIINDKFENFLRSFQTYRNFSKEYIKDLGDQQEQVVTKEVLSTDHGYMSAQKDSLENDKKALDTDYQEIERQKNALDNEQRAAVMRLSTEMSSVVGSSTPPFLEIPGKSKVITLSIKSLVPGKQTEDAIFEIEDNFKRLQIVVNNNVRIAANGIYAAQKEAADKVAPELESLRRDLKGYRKKLPFGGWTYETWRGGYWKLRGKIREAEQIVNALESMKNSLDHVFGHETSLDGYILSKNKSEGQSSGTSTGASIGVPIMGVNFGFSRNRSKGSNSGRGVSYNTGYFADTSYRPDIRVGMLLAECNDSGKTVIPVGVAQTLDIPSGCTQIKLLINDNAEFMDREVCDWNSAPGNTKGACSWSDKDISITIMPFESTESSFEDALPIISESALEDDLSTIAASPNPYVEGWNKIKQNLNRAGISEDVGNLLKPLVDNFVSRKVIEHRKAELQASYNSKASLVLAKKDQIRALEIKIESAERLINYRGNQEDLFEIRKNLIEEAQLIGRQNLVVYFSDLERWLNIYLESVSYHEPKRDLASSEEIQWIKDMLLEYKRILSENDPSDSDLCDALAASKVSNSELKGGTSVLVEQCKRELKDIEFVKIRENLQSLLFKERSEDQLMGVVVDGGIGHCSLNLGNPFKGDEENDNWIPTGDDSEKFKKQLYKNNINAEDFCSILNTRVRPVERYRHCIENFEDNFEEVVKDLEGIYAINFSTFLNSNDECELASVNMPTNPRILSVAVEYSGRTGRGSGSLGAVPLKTFVKKTQLTWWKDSNGTMFSSFVQKFDESNLTTGQIELGKNSLVRKVNFFNSENIIPYCEESGNAVINYSKFSCIQKILGEDVVGNGYRTISNSSEEVNVSRHFANRRPGNDWMTLMPVYKEDTAGEWDTRAAIADEDLELRFHLYLYTSQFL